MHHWVRIFQELRPSASLPILSAVASETQDSPRYHLEGASRLSASHCLFKYTLSGTGVFRDARGEHLVEPGHGFICEIRDPETAYYYPEWGTDPWTFLYATFSGDFAELLVRELTLRFGPVYELPQDHSLIVRLHEFGKMRQNECVMAPFEGAGFVAELLTTLGRSKEGDLRSKDNLVRRCEHFIVGQIGSDIRVAELAGLVGMSREHFTRRFIEEAGIPPGQFIIKRKMLMASRLLKDTDMSCKEISARLGYPDPARFVRTFRRFSGLTPGVFRKSGSYPLI